MLLIAIDPPVKFSSFLLHPRAVHTCTNALRRCSDPEYRGIAEFPIGAAVVEGFQAPISGRPAACQRGVTLVDLPYKVDDRQPSHPPRNGGADIEVNSGDKEE